jgi:hypothetical protein
MPRKIFNAPIPAVSSQNEYLHKIFHTQPPKHENYPVSQIGAGKLMDKKQYLMLSEGSETCRGTTDAVR